MTDPRVSDQARTVVEYSCKVKRNDFVLIIGSSESKALVVELASQIGKVGARFAFLVVDPQIQRAFELSADDLTLSQHPQPLIDMVRGADVVVQIISASNTQEESDVPLGKIQSAARAMGPLREAVLSKRWNVTLHPTGALAQDAKMSYDGYCDFVYRSILRDWPEMVNEMTVLQKKMAAAKKVRLVGKETDIAFSIEGRRPAIEGGEVNLPGGEVYVSPVDSTVTGTVYFDLPIVLAGHDVRGARLTFRNGEAVESAAEEGAELLRKMLAVDDGARRIGEFGVGMNRGIDRFTHQILFDEKMGDTIHMALGNSYESTGGTNRSGIHIDMIKSMKEGGAIYFDDEAVYTEGKFAWE